jgi:hypothetical protein
MTVTPVDVSTLYRARRGRVDFVDVPELGYLVIGGHGAPHEDGGPFQRAIQTLFAVSYASHFLVRKQLGEAPRVMPLEALWWVDGVDPSAFESAGPGAWHWQAMIVQPEPIDELTVQAAVDQARGKGVPDLGLLRYERWLEGRCAQTLHVGPYDAEGPTIAALHRGISAAGCRLRGRHHEIYLGDPRRSAPERLRTILRQPVAAAAEEQHQAEEQHHG